MLTNLLHGLTALGSPSAIIYLFAGALIGMFVGVVPGLGGAVVLSIMLVLVYHIDVTGTLCLFLGTYAGQYYSASISSILINTPSHPEAFAVTYDGFPMARRGQPGRALGLSAVSTCIGGIIGCIVLVGFLQVINYLPDLFHPPEYVGLVILAMLLVGTLGSDSVGKAVVATGAGFLVASIGPSSISGTSRFSFGSVSLYGGISLVGLALGLFAVTQMVMVFGTGTAFARQDLLGREIDPVPPVDLPGADVRRQLKGGIGEGARHWGVMLQGGMTGALTGLVPGIGGFAANFLSYTIARQMSRKRHQFGTGIPEGIIAAEASSLAKEAGSMVPIIGLGVPGSVGGALFIAALAVKNLTAGFGFAQEHPVIPYQIVWIIALSGLIGTVTGVLIGPFLAKVTRMPGPLVTPFILAVAVLGTFLADNMFFSVLEILPFGLLGLALRRLRYPLATFVLGLVLGQTFENNMYLTHRLYPGFSFLVRRPFGDVLLALSIAVLVLKVIEIRAERKKARAEVEAELADIDDPALQARVRLRERMRAVPYPLLAVLMSTFFVGVGTFAIVYAVIEYDFTTALMPVFAASLVAIAALASWPRDIYHYIMYRRLRAEEERTEHGEVARAVIEREHEVVGAVGTEQHGNATHAPEGSLQVRIREEGESSPLDSATRALLPPTNGGDVGEQANGLIVVDRSWGRNGLYRRELIAFAWLVGLIAGCALFGFTWGIPVFMAAYGLLATRSFLRGIRGRVLFAGLSAAIMWAVSYEGIKLAHVIYSPRF